MTDLTKNVILSVFRICPKQTKSAPIISRKAITIANYRRESLPFERSFAQLHLNGFFLGSAYAADFRDSIGVLFVLAK